MVVNGDQRFYVSTTRGRVKHAIFRRDPRAQLLVDDCTGFRAVLVPATVEIREDIAAELPRFRAIREKHQMAVPDDDEHLRALTAEGRVLLAITPDMPPSAWTCWAWTDCGIQRWQTGSRTLACPELRAGSPVKLPAGPMAEVMSARPGLARAPIRRFWGCRCLTRTGGTS